MLIDLHAHFLPGLDDGPRDMDEAMDLCRQAVADGVGKACACPHAFRTYRPKPERILAGLTELREALRAEGIPLEVGQGMECHLVPELPGLIAAGEILTLAGSRYLAVELPFESLPPNPEEVLFRVALAGLVPVVVHPERNSGIAAKPERLRTLLEQGVLAVVGADSLTGAFGRRTQQAAQNLVRRRLVQGVVSDAHHAGRRPVRLTAAQRIVTGLLGREAAQGFFRDFACCVWEDQAYDGGS